MFTIGRKYLYWLRQISVDLEKLAVVQYYMNYFFILTFFLNECVVGQENWGVLWRELIYAWGKCKLTEYSESVIFSGSYVVR